MRRDHFALKVHDARAEVHEAHEALKTLGPTLAEATETVADLAQLQPLPVTYGRSDYWPAEARPRMGAGSVVAEVRKLLDETRKRMEDAGHVPDEEAFLSARGRYGVGQFP